MGETSFYQIRNFPQVLRRAVKVAAALDGIPAYQWVIRELTRAVSRAGVVMEEGD